MLSALLFDMDGTLIDTNRAHVEAWRLALEQFHHKIAADRIGVEIGKGGDQFVPSVLGAQAEKEEGEKLRKAHDQEFAKIAKRTRFSLFPGVEPLLAAVRKAGIKVVLATSSGKEGLELALRSAGVDLLPRFDEVITAEDAKASKPAPDLIVAATRKLGLSPAQLAMIGDTPHDVIAARDAGVVTIGVDADGLNTEQTLRAAGARAVYRHPADILSRLDQALQQVSPGTIQLTQAVMEGLMHEALAEARAGLEQGEMPIGCVIARGDATIIARGHNESNQTQNRTAHAEMVAFFKAAGKIPPDALDLVLVSTLEPCVMCLGAAMQAAVDTVVYGLEGPANGGTRRVHPPVSPHTQMPRVVGRILREKSRDLFEKWFQAPHNPKQEPFVRQLLDET